LAALIYFEINFFGYSINDQPIYNLPKQKQKI